MGRLANEIRCLFVLPSLRGGGAERVVTLLLKHLNSCSLGPLSPGEVGAVRPPLDLHLALVECTGPLLADLPVHVTLHNLRAGRAAQAMLPLARLVHRLQPQVVFSTISHLNLAVALTRWTWPRGTRLIVRESATSQQVMGSAIWPSMRRALYRHCYRSADAIVCQTPYTLCDMRRTYGTQLAPLRLIPNPVDFAALDRLRLLGSCPLPARGDQPACWAVEHQDPLVESDPLRSTAALSEPGEAGVGPHVVSLGRLRPVKGTARILKAFPTLLGRHRGAQLWLLGDGPCEGELRRQAHALKIDRHVHFVGYQTNPYRWLDRADLMAFGSYSETCPNSVLEAVGCGCPVVSARHPGGTFEMLSYLGLQGRFVAQLDDWRDEWFAPHPATALQRARARYAAGQVAAQYRELLDEVTAGGALRQLEERAA